MQDNHSDSVSIIARIIVRYFTVNHDDPRLARRGQALIQLVTVLAVIALGSMVYLVCFRIFIHPTSDHTLVQMLSILGFLTGCVMSIILAQHGHVKPASIIWLTCLAGSIIAGSLPDFASSALQMMALLLLEIIMFGLLLGAGWSMIASAAVTVFEIALLLTLNSNLSVEHIAVIFLLNLAFGATTWILVGTIEHALLESDELRNRATHMRDEIMELSRLQSILLGRIGNRLKTQIDFVTASANILMQAEDDSLKSNGQQALTMILRNSRRLGRLGNELMGISDLQRSDIESLESGESGPPSSESTPSSLLLSIIAMLRERARRKGLRLRCVLDPRLPDQVSGISFILRYALFRIVSHAIESTTTGQVSVAVEPFDSTHWTIRVSDTRWATNITDNQEDLEIVLDVISDFITSIGGSLSTQHADGQGTTVIIALPLSSH